ncbi:hypothetical protein L218DRAFT_88015 [Marasmius fiardii PR-910]|nr:hypothetical protein L218DRAFT_88015 [Marasmius fiardii PR-910]
MSISDSSEQDLEIIEPSLTDAGVVEDKEDVEEAFEDGHAKKPDAGLGTQDHRIKQLERSNKRLKQLLAFQRLKVVAVEEEKKRLHFQIHKQEKMLQNHEKIDERHEQIVEGYEEIVETQKEMIERFKVKTERLTLENANLRAHLEGRAREGRGVRPDRFWVRMWRL